MKRRLYVLGTLVALAIGIRAADGRSDIRYVRGAFTGDDA